MAKKGSLFCDYCERKYFPKDSTAEQPEIFCSQACEAADHIEDSETESDEELDLKNGKR